MPRPKREVPWLDTIDGVFYVFWYDSEARRSRRRSLLTSEAGLAKEAFARFLTEGGVSQASAATVVPGVSIDVLFDDYLREHVPTLADGVRAIDAIDMLRPHFGGMTHTQLDPKSVEDYEAKRRSGEICKFMRDGKTKYLVGDGTIARELTVLSAAIGHAVYRKRISRAEVPKIRKPSVPTGIAPWLFPDELTKLFAAAESYGDDGRIAAFMRVAYYTAGRYESVARLHVSQVSVAMRRINLAPAGDRKTVKRRGVVPIDPAIADLVASLVENAGSDGCLFGKDAALYRPFVKSAERAGLRTLAAVDMRPEAACSPHILRHSRATHLLQNGKRPYAVAGLLHDDVNTVLKTYGHHCAAHIEEELMG